jgi:Nucleotidyl transferase AbiEii toxin, Type IV TA system
LVDREILGVPYRFVYAAPSALWGSEPFWVTPYERVTASDLERTILDGLARPDLCAGVSEVATTRDGLLLFPPVKAPLRMPYSDCRDRTETLLVYSPEEILAEKLCALLGRIEPGDLFDVHFMLTHRLVDLEAVSFRLSEKVAHKGAGPRLMHECV